MGHRNVGRDARNAVWSSVERQGPSVTAVVIGGLILAGLAGGVILIGYRMWVGSLDALALAVKTGGAPRPRSAVDGPEVTLDTVLPEPQSSDVLARYFPCVDADTYRFDPDGYGFDLLP